MQDYSKLILYNRSYTLSLNIYKLTRDFPKEELFGLISQIRRAATSIVLNIAEGAGKNTKKDFANFIGIGIGSCNELCVLLTLGKDLEYIEIEDYKKNLEETTQIRKMLIAFNKKLRF